MTGFDWFVAVVCSYFGGCCLLGAWAIATEYRGWLAKAYAVAYTGVGLVLLVVGWGPHGDARLIDDWFTWLVMPAMFGLGLWSQIEKKGWVTYIGKKQAADPSEQPPAS